ncbi:outer membrane protein [Nitrosospira multiformis]|uniref:Outer membrane protein n=1 Tax=Nitrosospira multiformis TaxID=1231 RepID=A0A1H9Y509_9PROT|nr:TolC family outer membrane protein [Nitrosospira multiformis]SES63848.1 outer membrane protein [Nitrosospira multiformis]
MFLSRSAKQSGIKSKIAPYVHAVLFIGVLSTPLQAADMMDIYHEALENDAQFRGARFTHQAAQEKLPQGRAGLLPTVTLAGVRRRQWIDIERIGGTGTATGTGVAVRPSEVVIDNQSLTITATQPIYRKENFAIYEQSKLQVAQADSEFIMAAQDLILRVAQAYLDILLAEVNVEVAEAQKKAISEQLAQAKRNFEVGTSTIVDTHEAQARFDLTAALEIGALNELEVRKRTLEQIIGRIPEDLAHPTETPSDLLTLKYPRMQDWISVAEQNNLALKVQEAVYEIAKKDVERAQAGHYPTLDLVAIYSDQKGVGGTITGRPIDLTSKEIGVQLSFPLFQGFAVQSRVREAVAIQEKVLQDLNNTRRNSVLQVSQQYLNVTNGIAQVTALKQALVSSQSQVDSTKLGQEVGVRTEVDVLNAQQLYYSARRDLAQARYNFLMSRLRLKAEAGELDEEDLKEVNDVLFRPQFPGPLQPPLAAH